MRLTASFSFRTSRSSSVIDPESASWSVAIVRINVDFPAPFGPTSPYMPVEIWSETRLSAVTPFGYVFERMEIVSCMGELDVTLRLLPFSQPRASFRPQRLDGVNANCPPGRNRARAYANRHQYPDHQRKHERMFDVGPEEEGGKDPRHGGRTRGAEHDTDRELTQCAAGDRPPDPPG